MSALKMSAGLAHEAAAGNTGPASAGPAAAADSLQLQARSQAAA